MSSELPSQTTQTGIVADLPRFADPQEAIRSMHDVLGRKWHPVLLYHLLDDGPLGFSALKDRTDGISSKMLSESLDDLQSAGLVSRELLSDQPVRVEYSLTARGRALEPLLAEMVRWGTEHTDDEAGEDADGRATVGRPAGGR
jgi:DNA-binding HxlR family transcriptional regulator